MENKASSTLLSDALDLIVSYHDNPSFRSRIDILVNQPRGIYQGSDGVWRPLIAYLYIAAQASEDPSLKGIYKKCHGKAEAVKEQTKEFLKAFYKKERARTTLQRKAQLETQNSLDQQSKESVEEIKKIDEETKGFSDVKRHDRYQETLEKISQAHPSPEQPKTTSSEPISETKALNLPEVPTAENPQFEAALRQVGHPVTSPVPSSAVTSKSETEEVLSPKTSSEAGETKEELPETQKPDHSKDQSFSPVTVQTTSSLPLPEDPDNRISGTPLAKEASFPLASTPEVKIPDSVFENNQPQPTVSRIVKLAQKIHLPLTIKVFIRKMILRVFTPTTLGVLTAGVTGAFVGASGGPRAALVGFGVGATLPLVIKKLNLGSTVFGGNGSSSYSDSSSNYDPDSDQEPDSGYQGGLGGRGGGSINNVVSIGKNARNMARLARAARAGKLVAGVTPAGAALLAWEHKKKIAYLVAGIIIVFFFFFKSILGNFSTLLVDTGEAAELFPEPPTSPGGGEIISCTFYRGGDSVSGLKFGNPNMAALISQISQELGVPASIVAGIMRVETASAVASTDNSYLTNDYDGHSSGVAYGIMQFTPGTFTGVFQANKTELQAKYNKTAATTNIDPQSSMAPASVFRIYSIKDSIIAAALKVRGDKSSINGDGLWDKPTVVEIARRYYGGLEYTGGNYGEDLWRSYSQCTSTSPTIAPPADNDYQRAIAQNFGIRMEGFGNPIVYQWAFEAFSKAQSKAPKFFTLLSKPYTGLDRVTVRPYRPGDSDTATHTKNSTGEIIVSNNSLVDERLFKQILIHESGHIIKGFAGENNDRGNNRPDKLNYTAKITELSRQEGYLTHYGEITQSADEAFPELVSYYILDDFVEQPTAPDRQTKWSIPPLQAVNGTKYRNHLVFIQEVFR